ncbi:MAG: gamma-glutamyltransferase family protein [Betaproteobacteria bacterium]|nr:gamma-glutamyltransferase family protein [Betaproteobacteria bacterium]NBT09860.1 gamma-glutamyltransferase family protein [Betaproteobacteria bacterium]NBX96861.1 gamma-glutamyltransferase family protein [Betaproteobacteria bacterium]
MGPCSGGGWRPLALALLAGILSGCESPWPTRAGQVQAELRLAADAVEPEAASAWTPREGWAGSRHMVAAANPLATEAGLLILRAGGSAVDAAVAVQMVLGLVEPQSSGLGGGALMLTWNGQRVQAFDGRETAPAGAREDQFLDAQGKPLPLQQAVFGGRAVATPGAVRMLELAHAQHGKLPWARLFEPAIRLAEDGFPVGPRLHRLLELDTLLRRDLRARAFYYQADGSPWPVGHRLRNPALAQVLRQLATQGARALHEGPVARSIARAVQSHPVPGTMDEADLRGYRALEREPICTSWSSHLRVCGFPPPSSGHLTLMQILGMLDAALPPHAGQRGSLTPEWLHHYNEAARLAYADRALYIADPAFVSPPAGRWDSLLQPDYLRQRAALIGPRAATQVEAGRPTGVTVAALAPMPLQMESGTSHISVVDAQGHAVSLTTTIEAQFGARLLVDGGSGLPGGFLLNNQMTDFSLAPRDATGRPIANRVQANKRPRSSMSPTLVFDERDGRLLMSVGSPGGGMIIHFTAKVLVATQRWGLNVQEAINLPNFVQVAGPIGLEKGRYPSSFIQQLQIRGHRIEERDLTSGIQAIERTATGWFGGADPRREGVVRAD